MLEQAKCNGTNNDLIHNTKMVKFIYAAEEALEKIITSILCKRA
jgi:hypothetical protein